MDWAAFFAGLGGGAANAGRNLMDWDAQNKDREQRAAEWEAQRKFSAEQNALQQAAADARARQERIQQSMDSAANREVQLDSNFGANLERMNVAALNPGAMRREMQPTALPGQWIKPQALPGGGQIPLGDILKRANADMQAKAAQRASGFMPAYQKAAQQGQQTQRDVPIEGYDAAYISEKFNPNTGLGSIYGSQNDAADRRMDAVDNTMKRAIEVLKNPVTARLVSDILTSPERKDEAMRRLREMAIKAYTEQWRLYQSVDPTLKDIQVDPSWIDTAIARTIANFSGGRAQQPGAGAPGAVNPDALDPSGITPPPSTGSGMSGDASAALRILGLEGGN